MVAMRIFPLKQLSTTFAAQTTKRAFLCVCRNVNKIKLIEPHGCTRWEKNPQPKPEAKHFLHTQTHQTIWNKKKQSFSIDEQKKRESHSLPNFRSVEWKNWNIFKMEILCHRHILLPSPSVGKQFKSSRICLETSSWGNILQNLNGVMAGPPGRKRSQPPKLLLWQVTVFCDANRFGWTNTDWWCTCSTVDGWIGRIEPFGAEIQTLDSGWMARWKLMIFYWIFVLLESYCKIEFAVIKFQKLVNW